MKALLFERKVARYAAAAVAGRLSPGRGARVGPLRLADVDLPELPADGLGAGASPGSPASAAPTSPPSTATRRATSSRSCRSRSCPATRWSATSTTAAASCSSRSSPARVRGIDAAVRPVRAPSATTCASGSRSATSSRACRPGSASRPAAGGRRCSSPTSRSCVDVPDDLTDEQAVLVEPMACAVHAARQRRRRRGRRVIGTGTLGLLTIAAIRGTCDLGGADHRRRQAPAPEAAGPGARRRRRVRAAGARPPRPQSATGSWVVDDRAHRRRRPRRRLRRLGRLAAAGARRRRAPAAPSTPSACPASPTLDLTGLWHREIIAPRLLRLRRRDDFATAIELVRDARPRPARLGHLSPRPLRATPSPTPPTPAAVAPSRSPSTSASEKESGTTRSRRAAASRVRPPGRQVDPAHPLLLTASGSASSGCPPSAAG